MPVALKWFAKCPGRRYRMLSSAVVPISNFRSNPSSPSQDSPDVWVTEQVAKKPKDKSVTMRRRFTPEGIEAELECDGVVSKEFYKRQ